MADESEVPVGYKAEILADFAAGLEGKRNQAPPGPVFHYASAESFRGIIEDGKIWLSNAAYLNDQNELSYPVALANDVLTACLSEHPKRHLLAEDIFLFEVREEIRKQPLLKPWYTASFSLECDRLSQWRAYCPTGGYAIGFDGPRLTEILKKHFALMFGAIEYDENTQRRKIKELIEHQLNRWRELKERHAQVTPDLFKNDFITNFEYAFGHEFLFFKAPAFHEEREWRLGQHAGAAERAAIKFRTKNGLLVPYVEIDLQDENGRLPLNSIWIGPLGDQQLAKHSAYLLLKAKGYEELHQIIRTSAYQLR